MNVHPGVRVVEKLLYIDLFNGPAPEERVELEEDADTANGTAVSGDVGFDVVAFDARFVVDSCK